MSTRQVSRSKLKKVPVGDMRYRIELYTRNIKAPGFNSASTSQVLTLLCKRWAAHDDLTPGQKFFNDVNIDQGEEPTDLFKIRYLETVTKETLIKYDGFYYEIKKVVPDRTRSFMFLFSFNKGKTLKGVNE